MFRYRSSRADRHSCLLALIPAFVSVSASDLWQKTCRGLALSGGEEHPSPYVSLLQRKSRNQSASSVLDSGATAPSICMNGKALPQLYLLGPQKSGTTTLASDLFSSGVRAPVDSKQCSVKKWMMACKELHSFDRFCNYNRSLGIQTTSRCELMSQAQKLDWAQSFTSCTPENVTENVLADMTPVNLRLPGLPSMMADVYGESRGSLRFVILLRNPVKRMHSGFYWHRSIPVNFSTWLQSQVIPGAQTFLANGSWSASTALETNTDLDQFYRSLMSEQLKPWLDAFHPAQFMLVPMSRYFEDVAFRREVFGQMLKQWGIRLQEPSFNNELGHENKASHRSLEEDLAPAAINDLYTNIFIPDAIKLASLLSNAIPSGLSLVGYTGPPNDAHEIKKFLKQSMDYPW